MKKIDILIIANLALILLVLWAAQSTNIDVFLQNYFFDFTAKTWLIDAHEPVKKFIFYKFPKILFGVAILALLLALLIGLYKKNNYCEKNFSKIMLIFLGLALIPLIAGNIKKFTNIYCPSQLEIYSGQHEYVKIFDKYQKPQEKKGECYPAGHAITGFALFILFFAAEKKRNKIIGLFAAIILGWALGLYQMLKGAHFLSDTLVAMLLCFLLAAIIAKINCQLNLTQQNI